MSQSITSGEWSAVNGGPYVIVNKAEGPRVICITSNTVNYVEFAAGVGSLEDQANARAIASVPVLLDVLDRISSGEFADNLPVEERLRAMRDIARAALAKARGER